jgi:hypothetical protein
VETHSWSLLFCMPYLDLQRNGENFDRTLGLAGIAVVDPSDDRVMSIRSRFPLANELLELYKTEYGNPVNTACLIVRDDWWKPLQKSATPIVAFRNSAALCDILVSRADFGGMRGAFWSDVYDFHAAELTVDGTRIDMHAPAVTHWGVPTKRLEFRLDPALPRAQPTLTDQRLEIVLGRIWRRRYMRHREKRAADRMYRSLETAAHAMGIRHRNYSSLHEAGLGAVLWVSAFEMLAAPKPGAVDRDYVLDLLEQLPWLGGRDLRRKRYWVKGRRKRRKGEDKNIVLPKRRHVNIAQKIYAQLYTARNKFVHGDKVSRGLLMPFGETGPPLLQFASTVYREALVQYILRHWKNIWREEDRLHGIWSDVAYRRHLEKAISAAAGKEIEDDT